MRFSAADHLCAEIPRRRCHTSPGNTSRVRRARTRQYDSPGRRSAASGTGAVPFAFCCPEDLSLRAMCWALLVVPPGTTGAQVPGAVHDPRGQCGFKISHGLGPVSKNATPDTVKPKAVISTQHKTLRRLCRTISPEFLLNLGTS